MSERITRANLEERCENVNRRIQETGRKVEVQGRNGYWGLDEYKHVSEPAFPERGRWEMQRTITVGTKREVGDFLHAMMVGMDLYRLRG